MTMRVAAARARLRLLRTVFLLPLAAAAAVPLHVGHGEQAIRQGVPRWFLRLFSRYEHQVMRVIDFLANSEPIYRFDLTRRLVMRLGELVMKAVNGEVLTLEEAREMVASAFDAGYVVAVGTCPCRRARNRISDCEPNNTDMVFGRWAEEYLANYPGLYYRPGREEALDLIEEFDRHGYLHQVYGFLSREGAAFVLCNCAPDICIPLQAQKRRGFQAFRKGRAVAVVDEGSCTGLEECGACLDRCPFDARMASGRAGRVDPEACFGCGLCVSTCRGAATSLARKDGARLIYAGRLVS